MFRLSLVTTVAVLAQVPPASPFTPRVFERDGRVMPYRLFVPDAVQRKQPLPLVVWLHGAHGVGTDNISQISAGGNELGSGLWVRPDIQSKFPSFVVAPQTPSGEMFGAPSSAKLTPYGQLVIELVEKLARELPIDRDRIYLVGQSRGGIGVWDLISKRPDVFAAAVPVCAAGDPKKVSAAANVKVWVFHGFKDVGMPVGTARDMVAALKAAGGAVKYTEYPDLAHDIWTRAFAEPELPAWLFAQRRSSGDDCPGHCH